MKDPGHEMPEADRQEELSRIMEAVRQAVREALLDHARAGHPVAVWRDERVIWLEPSEILGG